jgi:hypothetical protein
MSSSTYNLYSLQDDVLSLSNDSFYEFVTQVAGQLEANILKIQGIRNARTLLRSTDLFSIFKLDCNAVNELKQQVCWECKNGQIVVKQGIELNLKILTEVLKELHDKYIKKIHRQKKLSLNATAISTTTTLNDTPIVFRRVYLEPTFKKRKIYLAICFLELFEHQLSVN